LPAVERVDGSKKYYIEGYLVLDRRYCLDYFLGNQNIENDTH
jgi:hypothetical protein